MRFITWSTPTNAFFIFTVILPFLISTVNGVNFSFVSPSPDASGHGGIYIAGEKYEIIWNFTFDDIYLNVTINSTTSTIEGVCNLYLVDTNTVRNETLAMGVPIASVTLEVDPATNISIAQGLAMITYSPETIPGSDYFIDLESENIGSWHSNHITIGYH